MSVTLPIPKKSFPLHWIKVAISSEIIKHGPSIVQSAWSEPVELYQSVPCMHLRWSWEVWELRYFNLWPRVQDLLIFWLLIKMNFSIKWGVPVGPLLACTVLSSTSSSSAAVERTSISRDYWRETVAVGDTSMASSSQSSGSSGRQKRGAPSGARILAPGVASTAASSSFISMELSSTVHCPCHQQVGESLDQQKHHHTNLQG